MAFAALKYLTVTNIVLQPLNNVTRFWLNTGAHLVWLGEQHFSCRADSGLPYG